MHARVLPLRSRPARALLIAALALAPVVALAPARAGAQILRLPTRATQPRVWGQLGVGMLSIGGVSDGRTNSYWGFSQGAQYRASLEYDLGRIGRGLGIGIVGTHAPHVALNYDDGSENIDAHAVVSSLMGLVHIGGGAGVHQVLEIQGGLVRYADFTADNGGTLAPAHDTDPVIGISYGIGYSLSSRMQIALVQDAMQTFHQRDGLDNGARTNVAHYTTRLTLRYGLVMRRPGRL